MGRMEWLKELKKIFNKIAPGISEVEMSQHSVLKEQLVMEVSRRSTCLNLHDSKVYYSSSRTMALSLEEVLSVLSSIPKKFISWDDILDRIANAHLPIHEKESTPSTEDHLRYTEECVDKRLEIAYPQVKIREIPENLISEGLEYLSLAGNFISHTHWTFPQTLIVLNLAGNEIKEIHFTSRLENLKLLNLSNNRITSVVNLPNLCQLRELYVGYNSLQTLDNARPARLEILDASYNDLCEFENLSLMVHLKAIKFKGNPICLVEGYREKVRISKKTLLDPINLLSYSEFNSDFLPFVPLKRPPFKKENTEKKPRNRTRIRSDPGIVQTTNLHHKTNSTALPFCFLPNDGTLLTKAAKRIESKSQKKIVLTKELILSSSNKAYDNPVKAFMISPSNATKGKEERKKKMAKKANKTVTRKPYKN